MTHTIEVTAPGKLFLIGEYAVLDGAPALLTAVGRRVRVQMTPADDGCWQVSAPNLGIKALRLAEHGRLPGDLDATTRIRLAVFDAVRRTVAEQTADGFKAMHLVIDSSEFEHAGHKLGLGSSAAVATALTRAFALAGHLELSRSQIAGLAIRAHRQAQRGGGSGGDVAASVYGGFISYLRDQTPVALTWPKQLAGLVVVTGTGVRTVDLLARVRAYSQSDPDGYQADIARLGALADTVPRALARPNGFLQLAREYFEALNALDRGANAGIITDRHHELHALALRHNAVFKTSGAGGGDVGLAFVRNSPDVTALKEAFADAGAYVVPLSFGAPGVRVEPGD